MVRRAGNDDVRDAGGAADTSAVPASEFTIAATGDGRIVSAIDRRWPIKNDGSNCGALRSRTTDYKPSHRPCVGHGQRSAPIPKNTAREDVWISPVRTLRWLEPLASRSSSSTRPFYCCHM